MSGDRITLGQAIDLIEKALAHFDGPDQQTILVAVCSHLKIGLSTPLTAPLTPGAQLNSAKPIPLAPSGLEGVDIKTLKNVKQPSSAIQMACVVAYYLAELAPETERKKTLTVTDLERYFKQAGFPLNQKMEQLPVDAKRAGYFDSAARGEYALNRVGHNLVAHQLPRKSGE
jgi:hypothetical protein